MGRGSTEALIYMAWLRELMHVLFADELGDVFEDYWKIRTEVIHRALAERPKWCDNETTSAQETCAEAVSRALKISLEFLAVTYGHDMEDWRWGEAHAVHMQSRILGKVPAVGSWFEIDMPSGGEKETVKAGGFDVADEERPFAQNHGAGYRAIYDLSAPERSVFIQSTGQSGNPLSSHYEDYAEAWRDGRYLPMLTDRAGRGGGRAGDAGVRAEVRGVSADSVLRCARPGLGKGGFVQPYGELERSPQANVECSTRVSGSADQESRKEPEFGTKGLSRPERPTSATARQVLDTDGGLRVHARSSEFRLQGFRSYARASPPDEPDRLHVAAVGLAPKRRRAHHGLLPVVVHFRTMDSKRT